MKTTTFLTGLAALLLTASAHAADLTLTATATPDGSLYDYDYQFHVSGAAAIDNLYLGSDDLSPVSGVTFKKNGAPTSDWLWLGNDTPTNYLQFFSTTDSLGDGATLEVQFSSPASLFRPTQDHFASGFDSGSRQSFTVAGSVVGPTAVPEPGVISLFGAALLGSSLLVRRRRTV